MKAKFLVLAMVLGLVSVPALADTITLDITNPGFESGTIGVGKPNGFGVWGGDKSEIVTTEKGITPFEGSQMLHFIYSRRMANWCRYSPGSSRSLCPGCGTPPAPESSA